MNERLRAFAEHPVSQVIGGILGVTLTLGAPDIANALVDRPSDAEVANAQAIAEAPHTQDSLLYADAARYEDLLRERENHDEVFRFAVVGGTVLLVASAAGYGRNLAQARRANQKPGLATE